MTSTVQAPLDTAPLPADRSAYRAALRWMSAAAILGKKEDDSLKKLEDDLQWRRTSRLGRDKEVATDHVVQQGEHISGIAQRYGFADYKTIWDRPENGELKGKRPNPHVLSPGDRLYIPDKEEKTVPCETGRQHSFTVRLQRLKLRIVLTDFDNLPVSGAECQLEVGGTSYNLVTNAQGLIEQEIPRTTEGGKLTVASLGIETPVKIGYLDPDGEDSGWQARLINLGYHAGDSSSEALLRHAIEEFQCDMKLKVTGEIDGATKAKLKELHGS